jgi:protocatechuate 3,4-dioxygenase beta subunit
MWRFPAWRTLFRMSVPFLSAAVFSGTVFPQLSPFINDDRANSVTHVLTGVVVNAVSGAPVPYALVQVGQEAKLADQNGAFRFEALPYSSASMMARKPGYFSEQELSDDNSQSGTVVLSGETSSVTIRLTPEAVISGHVINSLGDPVEHLPINVKFNHVVAGRRMWEQRGTAETDENGNFRIPELKPGT